MGKRTKRFGFGVKIGSSDLTGTFLGSTASTTLEESVFSFTSKSVNLRASCLRGEGSTMADDIFLRREITRWRHTNKNLLELCTKDFTCDIIYHCSRMLQIFSFPA
jgi:hypothetical protein